MLAEVPFPDINPGKAVEDSRVARDPGLMQIKDPQRHERMIFKGHPAAMPAT